MSELAMVANSRRTASRFNSLLAAKLARRRWISPLTFALDNSRDPCGLAVRLE
jgi:hypothetical protein